MSTTTLIIVATTFNTRKGYYMKITHVLLAGTLAFGLANIAYANHHTGDEAKHSCGNADANKDGVISKDEFMAQHQARAEKMFTKLDTNKDGKIDDAEQKAAHSATGHTHTKESK